MNRGFEVKPKRGTGEWIFRDPASGRTVTVNARRKDSPRALTSFLNRGRTT